MKKGLIAFFVIAALGFIYMMALGVRDRVGYHDYTIPIRAANNR